MNITKLDDKIAVAAQPRVDDLADMAAAGFRGIINNRPDAEGPTRSRVRQKRVPQPDFTPVRTVGQADSV